jgi:protein-tyrosine phosphatase
VPWDVQELYAGGIGGIISLDALGVDGDQLRTAGIAHLPLYRPMIFLDDQAQRLTFLECMPEVLRFVAAMEQKQAAVLIHCYYGCDRTGAALACSLIAREGLSAAAAIARVRRSQPQALLAPGYLEAVHLFEQSRRGVVADQAPARTGEASQEIELTG